MVLTRLENFHLALLAHEEAPTVNALAHLLAQAMERPWVMGTRRPARILLRNNPQWQELIPHLRQLKIEVETQEELPVWDNAATEYVRKLTTTRQTARAPHSCIAYAARSPNHPAISSGVTSCRAEPNAA